MICKCWNLLILWQKMTHYVEILAKWHRIYVSSFAKCKCVVFFSLLSNMIHCVFAKRMHFKYIVHCLSILAIERASVMNNRLHFGSFTVLFTTAISAIAYVFKSLIHRRAVLHIHMYPSTVSFELYVIRVWCVLLESELYTMKIINKAIVCCTGIKHSVLVVRISRAKNVDLNRCALWYVLFQSNCIQTFHSIHEWVQIRFFRTPSLSCNWFLCIYFSHSIYLIN